MQKSEHQAFKNSESTLLASFERFIEDYDGFKENGHLLSTVHGNIAMPFRMGHIYAPAGLKEKHLARLRFLSGVKTNMSAKARF